MSPCQLSNLCVYLLKLKSFIILIMMLFISSSNNNKNSNDDESSNNSNKQNYNVISLPWIWCPRAASFVFTTPLDLTTAPRRAVPLTMETTGLSVAKLIVTPRVIQQPHPFASLVIFKTRALRPRWRVDVCRRWPSGFWKVKFTLIVKFGQAVRRRKEPNVHWSYVPLLEELHDVSDVCIERVSALLFLFILPPFLPAPLFPFIFSSHASIMGCRFSIVKF